MDSKDGAGGVLRNRPSWREIDWARSSMPIIRRKGKMLTRGGKHLPFYYQVALISGALSSDQEVVVLLASLDEEVAVGDELSCGDQIIWRSDLLLVDAEASCSDELTKFTFGG
mgnify:CR=1 FL=1